MERQGDQVEVVRSSTAFDVCSLMLFGTQAIPVRLKILLDRIFSVLQQDEVMRILAALGWTLQDYVRGYVLQDLTGKVLDCWSTMSFEEEMTTLQQFLRFGETRSIVELMTAQEGLTVTSPSQSSEFCMGAILKSSDTCWPDAGWQRTGERHPFDSLLTNMAFMLPFHCLGFAPTPLLGSTPTMGLFHSESDTKLEEPGTKSNSVYLTRKVEQNLLRAPAQVAINMNSEGHATCHEVPMTFDPTSVFPKRKIRTAENSNNSGSDLKKGRVFCTTCEKTFYDKGTLKIHHNAVHLKVKHQCTVQGCNMVFSSLRSRNRHSANPNPRLHTPLNRNSWAGTPGNSPHTSEASGAEKKPKLRVASFCFREQSVPPEITSHTSDPKLQGRHGPLPPNLRTKQPTMPFYYSGIGSPEEGTITSLGPADIQHDLVTKKKPRKSSKPIKIKKYAPEIVERQMEERHSDKTAAVQGQLDLRLSTVLSVGMECPSSDPIRNDNHSKMLKTPTHEGHTSEHPRNQSNSTNHPKDNTQPPSEGLFRTLTSHMQGSKGSAEDCINDLPHLMCVCQGNAPNRCDTRSKPSESSYTIRMHYCSAHIKEMRLCGMDCCNAVFPTWGNMHR